MPDSIHMSVGSRSELRQPGGDATGSSASIAGPTDLQPITLLAGTGHRSHCRSRYEVRR
jgi:hypothetical protein